MKNWLVIFFIILCLCPTSKIIAQISPGKLAQAHSHLEGISNCTQCHDLGNKVPDSKCLDCHSEIKALINTGLGYHSSKEVVNSECVKCHNDHHGLKFEMIRIDIENFDHSLTGYNLIGKHKSVDCRQCHTAENIENPDLRFRNNTFLGLTENCSSCHVDYHQETLGPDCASCHDENAFRPAPYFDHDDTNFSLAGAHRSLECIDCHALSTSNDMEFQKFSGISFQTCTACHDDAHNGNLPGNCTSCHNETSFSSFPVKSRFNHNLTGFTLKGKHKSIDCFSCHSSNSSPMSVFQDKNGIEEESCISCHEDVHLGKFGNNCIQCHTEESFIGIKETSNFDHTLTDFPLEGKHNNVECKSCHISDFISPLAFGQCFECHEDFHEGAFVKENSRKDCKDCHSLNEDFSYTTFTFEDHNKTKFTLEGAHLATPCFSCHLTEDEEWNFNSLGTTCVDCHENIHENDLAAKYYIDNDCSSCHITNDWGSNHFNHDLTSWSLEGAHRTLDCGTCHLDQKENKFSFKLYSQTISPECSQCHFDVHNNQFTEKGKSRCSECHNPENWNPLGFNHNNASFRLDGAHVNVECIKCHKILENEEGLRYSEYKPIKHECVDCHF